MLTQLIDQYIFDRQLHDTQERDNSKFRVSDAGKCRLMRYWKRQGKPANVAWGKETLRVMQLGINIHEWIEKIVSDLPGGVERVVSEHHLEDEHRIGHFDLYLELTSPLIDDRDPLRYILYDIKTKGGKQWYYFERDGRKTDIIHAYQIVSYWLMANDEGFPIDSCRIAYINRDTLEMHENTVLHDMLCEEVETDWNLLIRAWEQQEEPEPSPATDWECRYCIYNKECPYV